MLLLLLLLLLLLSLLLFLRYLGLCREATEDMSILGLLFAPTDSTRCKHWKSASFANLPHFILPDLTNNLITYSSFLIALHFFSTLALVLYYFHFIFVSSCLHFLSLMRHHYSFAFELYRIYSSFTALVLLILLHLITGSA